MAIYRAGADVGSTTVKLVVIDDSGKIIYGDYRRHCARTRETLAQLMDEARSVLGDVSLRMRITGSGSINLAKAVNIDFIQEVAAVASAVKFVAPQTDVSIELGGEDAKIIYFKGGLEERMNGVCAGGTGAFIDQMAALLQTDAAGLNQQAKDYNQIYPIAARCGVFAKTDIQPLINEGAKPCDLAASVLQAVVNQTVSGLACGKPIRGCVAFLGGPLHFLTELKKAFIRTLGLTPENIVDPENSHLFAALGAALEAGSSRALTLDELIHRTENSPAVVVETKRLEPLFAIADEYEDFCLRHSKAILPKKELSEYRGNCYLGIDAGSTTTKLALIGEGGELLYSHYTNNRSNPVKTAQEALCDIASKLPAGAKIVRSCSTGYGEALLKAAFSLDEGEVETVAHTTAAAFFDPQVDCVLDIGGQDMKCIKLKNGAVDTVLLNEACSSGCGSFIENFANSLGYSAADFSKEALFAAQPVDLGTRCTVFMNSNVKQAQKEGATVADISAGLAYSVVKNALFKVVKLASASDLGSHIVAQGGTFYNKAVLRALEKISGASVVCPDISGLMGAFGAALIAKQRYHGQPTSMLNADEIKNLEYTSSGVRCGRCPNNCMMTINKFPGGRRHISGNRCEKPTSGGEGERAPNMFEYKRKRMFDYQSLDADSAPRGVIGLPRVLNMYENYPYWATFFTKLGFSVVISPFSDRKIYELGMETIPSESECYPAKLSHGHVQWLMNHGIKTIFHPCVFYERRETKGSANNFNCPIVISYAENLKNNMEAIEQGDVHYIRPFIAMTDEKTASDRLVRVCREEWNIEENEVRAAAKAAWDELIRTKNDIRKEGARLLCEMEKKGARGIVLAGRPYHIDPEINHGIPELIASYGQTVFTEDSLPVEPDLTDRPLRVLDQWTYHSRLYTAAEFVRKRDDLELIQLNSFGCGIDAVTTDQVNEILDGSGKLYTLLKIDEVNNLGAVRIRVRSLLAAVKMRRERGICTSPAPIAHQRKEFTKEMLGKGYTILAPDMSPIHFRLLETAFRKHGYNIVLMKNDTRKAIDAGLKYVNNDACYPSIVVVGQFMDEVLSGKYDTDKLALIMFQTGGCCRASNYMGFIRRALAKAGYSHIPVISVNFSGLEKNSGFSLTPTLLADVAKSIVYGDLMMRCLYRVRPYELEKGSADALYEKWNGICAESIRDKKSYRYKDVCRDLVADFDVLPIDPTLRKPRVGIVGEILVKYMPFANNDLVRLLEREGAEAVVPDLLDFLNYSMYNSIYKHEFLGRKKITAMASEAGLRVVKALRKPALDALENSRRFEVPMPIEEIARLTKPILSLGNQYGEGWFLAGEMAELLSSGVPNIVCIQPFACLPNHVVGKGVFKALRRLYPNANIAAVDYDPGASEVNQLNRIKLMLSSAVSALPQEETVPETSKETVNV